MRSQNSKFGIDFSPTVFLIFIATRISSISAISLAIQVTELLESAGYPVEELISEVDELISGSKIEGTTNKSPKLSAAKTLVEKFNQIASTMGSQDTESLAPGNVQPMHFYFLIKRN